MGEGRRERERGDGEGREGQTQTARGCERDIYIERERRGCARERRGVKEGEKEV